MGISESWSSDCRFHFQLSEKHNPGLLRRLANASVMAALLFRMSANSHGVGHVIVRALTLSLYASDVSPGARFLGPIDFPHPSGIVIGHGVIVGKNTRIFQHVTIGASGRGGYPVIEEDVTIYAGAVIAGNITIGSGTVIGANAVVTRSVGPGQTVRARDAI